MEAWEASTIHKWVIPKCAAIPSLVCVPTEAQPSTSAKMKCVKPHPQFPRSPFTQGCLSQETDHTMFSSITYHNVYNLVNYGQLK